MHQALRLVSERFRQMGGDAARLFEDDDSFRDLCEEYEVCTRTVTRLEAMESPSQEMLNEYKALLLRLERELLRYLEEHPKQG
jgi:hypothetical protein